MISPEQTAALQERIDERRVHPPARGKFGDYLESWDVIETANRIFGFDGWSFEVHSLDAAATTTEKGEISGTLAVAHGTIEALGVKRRDVGTNAVSYRTSDGYASPDAWATAYKGAVSDCLKRCLRTFGDQFGNSLYDKDREQDGDLGADHEKPRGLQEGARQPSSASAMPREAICPDHPQSMAREPWTAKGGPNKDREVWHCSGKTEEGRWCRWEYPVGFGATLSEESDALPFVELPAITAEQWRAFSAAMRTAKVQNADVAALTGGLLPADARRWMMAHGAQSVSNGFDMIMDRLLAERQERTR